MSYQRKLTVANTFGKINVDDIPAKGELWLLRIFGHVNNTKGGIPSPYGDSTALLGQFKWLVLSTGEEFTASRAFVPLVLQEEVEGQMSPENKHVDFVIDLGVKKSAKGQMGYEYVIRPVIDVSGGTDPLAALEEKAAAALKALPAPKAPAEPKQQAGGRRR